MTPDIAMNWLMPAMCWAFLILATIFVAGVMVGAAAQWVRDFHRSKGW